MTEEEYTPPVGNDSPFVYPPGKMINTGGSTPFWSSQPSILLQRNRLSNFFPTAQATIAENMNAIVRLFIFLAIILILYTRNSQYLLLPLGGMLVTYILYHMYPNKQEMFGGSCTPISRKRTFGSCNLQRIPSQETDSLERDCVLPTVDNPFMNFNYITDNYHRDPACKAWLYDDEQSQQVRQEVTESFNYDLYRDVGDLYSKNNSQRQFFTMPWTSWPNDQTTFAKWLYRTGPTCKELGAKCAPYWNPSVSYSILEN